MKQSVSTVDRQLQEKIRMCEALNHIHFEPDLLFLLHYVKTCPTGLPFAFSTKSAKLAFLTD